MESIALELRLIVANEYKATNIPATVIGIPKNTLLSEFGN